MVKILDAKEYIQQVQDQKTSSEWILQMYNLKEKDPFLRYQQRHGINNLGAAHATVVRWHRNIDGTIIVENRGGHDVNQWPFDVLASYSEKEGGE